jgi:hypothetical protein
MKKILSDEECDFIADWVLSNEDYIKSFGPDVYKGTSENSLTGRYNVFNYLNVPELESILAPKLKKSFLEIGVSNPLGIQCWGNIFRKNEGIGTHKHGPMDFFCGNIFIKGPTRPGTFYAQYGPIENERGVLTLFKSSDMHGVPPNQSDEVRISLAFDAFDLTIKDGDIVPFHKAEKLTDMAKSYTLE